MLDTKVTMSDEQINRILESISGELLNGCGYSFNNLFANIPAPFKNEYIRNKLFNAYTTHNRYYHNLAHISSMWAIFTKFWDPAGNTTARRKKPLDLNSREIESLALGILYHDAVYIIGEKGMNGVNEQASARQLWLDYLTCTSHYESKDCVDSEYLVKETMKNILATFGKHCEDNGKVGNILCGLDLAALTDYNTMVKNTALIRLENLHVNVDTFNQNQIKFFNYLLAQPVIYRDPTLNCVFEEVTRKNLSKFIQYNTN